MSDVRPPGRWPLVLAAVVALVVAAGLLGYRLVAGGRRQRAATRCPGQPGTCASRTRLAGLRGRARSAMCLLGGSRVLVRPVGPHLPTSCAAVAGAADLDRGAGAGESGDQHRRSRDSVERVRVGVAVRGRVAVARQVRLVWPDPRGTGLSEPTLVTCPQEPLLTRQGAGRRAFTWPQVTGFRIGQEAPLGAECMRHNAVDGKLLGTREVVRDLDALRQALGDDQLTFLGYSYGTRIGTQYAQAFPDRVRAMVPTAAWTPAAQSWASGRRWRPGVSSRRSSSGRRCRRACRACTTRSCSGCAPR